MAGRRPGDSGARAAILAAARRAFAEHGFTHATLRAIAAEAGVDPALVRHYFGSKRGLFVESVELPFAPNEVFPRLFGGEPERAGERLAEFLVAMLEAEASRVVFLGFLRAGIEDAETAELLQRRLSSELFGAIVASLTTDEPQLRASLVASQVVGLVFVRYIVRLEPLASLPREAVVAILGPALQHYITGPLGAPTSEASHG